MEIVFDEPEKFRAHGWDDKRRETWLVKCYPFGAENLARWFNVDPAAWKQSERYRDTIKQAVRERFQAQLS